MESHIPLDSEQFSESFRFRLGTAPGEIEEFFALSRDAPAVLLERERWLGDSPGLYAGLLPEGVPLAEELAEVAATWTALSGNSLPAFDSRDPLESLVRLSVRLEPDLVLLKPDDRGGFVVAGGCVCFPSMWRLTDKIGRTTEETHAPVPGLNDALARNIDRLMGGLRGGRCVTRWNWGVAAAPELNQHPERRLPWLEPPLDPDRVWLRREHQALFALPRTGGIIFGIRVLHDSWRTLRDARPAARCVAETLRTMPPAMLEYKRLDRFRDELIRLLE